VGLSGISSCVITQRRHTKGGVTIVHWTAVATDKAGNTTTVRGSYRIAS
jgi:hypothetical protein